MCLTVSETERVVTIGQLVGRLPAGAGSMAGFREDKRNKASPSQYYAVLTVCACAQPLIGIRC